MRVQIAIQSDHIFKTVSSSSGYYEWVCEELDTYRRWIEKVGFSTLKTEITYNPDTSQMTFMQIYLEGQSAPDYKLIYSKLLHLQLDHFGLDANPDNFIFTHNEIYFIDYHPILIKDHPHSHSHFAYPANLINKRYHDIDGVILLFLNRLFKRNAAQAVEIYEQWIKDRKADLSKLSKRDVDRLHFALNLIKAGTFTIDIYSEYYASTKDIFT